MNTTPMPCPLCSQDLVPGKKAHYETLIEHVTDPNGTPSLKQGYECQNKYCPARHYSPAWLFDGEGSGHPGTT